MKNGGNMYKANLLLATKQMTSHLFIFYFGLTIKNNQFCSTSPTN